MHSDTIDATCRKFVVARDIATPTARGISKLPERRPRLRKSPPFRAEKTLKLGHEISYLRGGDKFGCVIEDDALDLVADVSPIKNVSDIGKRHHDEAT
jgi:hypothetical protein